MGLTPEQNDRLNGVTVEQVADAMQFAWDDFVGDTGCYPDCIKQVGDKLLADFHFGNFARTVTEVLNRGR